MTQTYSDSIQNIRHVFSGMLFDDADYISKLFEQELEERHTRINSECKVK